MEAKPRRARCRNPPGLPAARPRTTTCPHCRWCRAEAPRQAASRRSWNRSRLPAAARPRCAWSREKFPAIGALVLAPMAASVMAARRNPAMRGDDIFAQNGSMKLMQLRRLEETRAVAGLDARLDGLAVAVDRHRDF